MTSHPGAERFVPESRDLDEVRAAAAGCQGCDLWRQATQTVFGEGPSGAQLVLVGEQPGDHEDIEGHPFVGPAGRVLDDALELAGIVREQAYLTNAVKHFRWQPRGKRRLHERPLRSHMSPAARGSGRRSRSSTLALSCSWAPSQRSRCSVRTSA